VIARLGAALLVSLLAALGTSTACAVPVAAHASQAETTPEEGSVLTAAPTSVVVRFDSPVLDIGAAIVVRDASGTSVVVGAPRIDRQQITVDVDPDAPPGEYTVAYRVVAEDGHTLESSFGYTVAGDQPAPADGSAATEAPSPASAPATAEPASEPASIPPLLLIAGGVLVLLLAGAGAIALRR
jgi:methionine-rich copper-binding protein CopC